MQKIIIDENQFQRTVSRISHEIIEKHSNLNNVVIVGIKRRGAEIAELIKNKIVDLIQIELPSIELDITFYRDDLQHRESENPTPVYSGASNYMNIQNKMKKG